MVLQEATESGGSSKRKAPDRSGEQGDDKRSKLSTSSHERDNSDPELGSVFRRRKTPRGGDEWVCPDCSAIFVKYMDAKSHARQGRY